MNLSNVDFKKLADVVTRDTENKHFALCINDWNGFEKDHTYEIFAENFSQSCRIFMLDKHGLKTAISKDHGADYFVVDALPDYFKDIPEPEPKEVPMHVRLQLLAARMMEKNSFAVGELVTWKEGLSNRKIPSHGHPAIVTEVLDTPIFDGNDNNSSGYFREPTDIKVGVIVPSGDGETFSEYYVDSRRMRHFDPDSDGVSTIQDDRKLLVPKFVAVKLN